MFSLSKRDRTLSTGKKDKDKDAFQRKKGSSKPFEIGISQEERPFPPSNNQPQSNALPFMLGSGSSSKVLYQLGAPVTLAGPRNNEQLHSISVDDVDLDTEDAQVDRQHKLDPRNRSGKTRSSSNSSVDSNNNAFINLRRPSHSNLGMARRSSLAKIVDMSPTEKQKDTFATQNTFLNADALPHNRSPSGSRQSSQISSTDSLLPSRQPASSATSLSSTTPPASASTSRSAFVFNPNYTVKADNTSTSSLGSKKSSNGKHSVRTYRNPVSAEPKGSPILSIADKSLHSVASSPNLGPKRQFGSGVSIEGADFAPETTHFADPTEEIVPWMFAPADGSKDGERPPIHPRSRHTSAVSRSDSMVSPRSPTLRNTQSSVHLARQSSQNSDESNMRKTSASKGIFGRLRRKISRADLEGDGLANPTAWEPSIYNSPSLSSIAPRKSIMSVGVPLRSRKQSSKDRSGGAGKAPALEDLLSRPGAAAAAAAAMTGITLDTDMDDMEGIVSMDSIHAAQVNGVPTYLNDSALVGRPRTPDSAVASNIQRRRPSVAFSALTGLDSGMDSANDSPLSARSMLSSRQPSLAPDAIVWNASFGNHNRPPLSNYSARRPSLDGIGINMNPPSSAVSTANSNSKHSTDRKVSAGMQGAAAANEASRAAHAAQLATLNTAASEAGWTAPESWAVEENVDGDNDGDRSDEEVHAECSPRPSQLGPNSPLLQQIEDVRRESWSRGGVSITGSDRPQSAKGRPLTATSQPLSTNDRTANFTIRVFKPDGTHTTIIAPFMQTVSDIQYTVARKPGFVKTKGAHRLFVFEKGVERPMVANERPIRLQQLRLEQAGYTEWDKPEDLGREDHSYLIKFVYKPDVAQRAGSDDLQVSSFEYVDLRGRSLTTIPIFLYNHAHDIVSLVLSRNPKLDLPADFVQLCTELRELRLSETAIKRIPQSVKHAARLTRLDISNNRILDLDHIRLDELAELTRIEVFNNRLFTLPSYFADFKSLKYLIVSNNKFEVFPSIICEIASLVELDMSFNLLTSLPDDIGKLASLERLCLAGNSIATLPATMHMLTSLRELDLRRNNVDDLSVVDNLPRLASLQIEHNRVSVLTCNLPVLKKCRVIHNPLTKFVPVGTGNTLTCLNLSNAKLTALDDAMFAGLAALDNIYLDHNSIRVLPEAICTLANLTTLSCRYNKLESLPESIGQLTSLQVLNVSNNDLHSLPSSVWVLAELGTLNASSNLLTEFPDPPAIALTQPLTHVLSTIEGEDGLLPTKPSQPAASNNTALVAVLEHLYLADNRLPDESFHPISLLTELKVLNLSFNEIFEIPHRTLAKNSQLETLYLSGNKLTTLPEDDFEKLIDLKILHLNGNKLNTLPAELGTLKKLQALDVGSNMLKYNIANWKYDWNWNWNLELRYLNLSGNKRLEIKPAGPQVHSHDGDVSVAKRRNLSDFSALRKVRTLGLMDVTLTIPAIPDDNEERRVRTSLSQVNEMGYGIADTLGLVDNLNVIDLVVPRFRGKDDECLLGIFDGQGATAAAGGARLPRFLQESFSNQLHLELNRMIEGEADVSDVLRRSFVNLNREYGNVLLPTGDSYRRADGERSNNASSIRSGASGVVAYVAQKVLYVANAGHAQAVLAGRNGQARPLTSKHDPLERQEYTRIRAAEGWISNKGLVNDDVPVSRSFGHYHLFPAVNASPSIQVVELSELDELVILANAGIWDFIDYQTAVDIARGERSDPMMAAQKLRDMAIAYGSANHIMVMVMSVADLFKTKLAPKRRGGLAADSAAGYALAKAAGRGRTAEIVPTERYLSMVDREIPAPTGTVAVIFTDIRNSTSLWESDENMHVAVRLHNQIMRRQLRSIGGYEVKTEGDAFMCSFPSVTSAVLWAFTTQLELMRGDWPQSILDNDEGAEVEAPDGETIYRGLCVRMGIHWGQPHCEADPITRRMDYFGPMVNRAARISAVADGGQIAVSSEVVEIVKRLCGERTADELIEDDDELDEPTKRDITAIRNMGVCITELGERKLKGLETADVLSLIYPSALTGRLKYATNTNNAGAPIALSTGALDAHTETIKAVPHFLDVAQMRELGVAALRLEGAAASHMHPPLPFAAALASSPAIRLNGSPSLSRSRRKLSLHPHLTDYPLRLDATDEELMAVLESLVIRVENAANSLTMHRLGPYSEVLAALSSLTRNDPRMLLNALTIYAGMMRN